MWSFKGAELILSEDASTPAFSYTFKFENVPDSRIMLLVTGHYGGNLGHIVKLMIYNHTTGNWDSMTNNEEDLPVETSNQAYSFWLPSP